MIRIFYNYDPLTETLNVNKFEELPTDEYTNVAHTIEDLNFNKVDIEFAWCEKWGSFLQWLWYTLSHADMNNAKIILENFGHYVYQYYKEWLLKPIDEADLSERKLANKDLLNEFIS